MGKRRVGCAELEMDWMGWGCIDSGARRRSERARAFEEGALYVDSVVLMGQNDGDSGERCGRAASWCFCVVVLSLGYGRSKKA